MPTPSTPALAADPAFIHRPSDIITDPLPCVSSLDLHSHLERTIVTIVTIEHRRLSPIRRSPLSLSLSGFFLVVVELVDLIAS